MAKQKATAGSKGRPGKTLDRAARIAHGEAVAEAVKKRKDEAQNKSNRAGIGLQGAAFSRATIASYEKEAITAHAFKAGLEEDDVRACVALTKVIAEISPNEPELEEAVRSGRLMILKSELPRVAKLRSPEIDEWLRDRLRDQI